MNDFIVYPLLILVVIGSFNYIYLYDNTNLTITNPDNQTYNLSQSQTLNGSESEMAVDSSGYGFSLDMTNMLVIIIGITIVISLLGASALGSHVFSERGLKMFYNSVLWYGLWAVFSALSFSVIVNVPYFGMLAWFGATLIYSLGVFGKIGE